MNPTRLVPLGIALLALAVTAPGQAMPGNPNLGRRHDPGHFFMRLSAGFGFSSASFDDSGDTKLSGIGGLGSFKFGATIAPNVALGVDLFGLSMFEPSVTQNGQDLGNAEGTRATMGAIGIGGTFYVMPANLYIAGSVGAAIGTLEFRGRFGNVIIEAKEDTKVGLGLNVMVGKEWWVSRRWGIGLAAQATYAALETDAGDGLGVFGVGLLFSATVN